MCLIHIHGFVESSVQVSQLCTEMDSNFMIDVILKEQDEEIKFPLKRKIGQLKLPTQTLWYVFLCHWDAKTLTSWLMYGKKEDRASPLPLLVAWLLWSEASHFLYPKSLWSFCKHCWWSHSFMILVIFKFFLTVSKDCPIIFKVLIAFSKWYHSASVQNLSLLYQRKTSLHWHF